MTRVSAVQRNGEYLAFTRCFADRVFRYDKYLVFPRCLATSLCIVDDGIRDHIWAAKHQLNTCLIPDIHLVQVRGSPGVYMVFSWCFVVFRIIFTDRKTPGVHQAFPGATGLAATAVTLDSCLSGVYLVFPRCSRRTMSDSLLPGKHQVKTWRAGCRAESEALPLFSARFRARDRNARFSAVLRPALHNFRPRSAFLPFPFRFARPFSRSGSDVETPRRRGRAKGEGGPFA